MSEDNKSQREEFAAARRALVDKYVADNPGLNHTDFNDVAIADFDTHATTLVAAQSQRDREAGARAAGVTVEEFDALVAARNQGQQESTPEQRTANLPAGRAATIPTLTPPATQGADGPKSGIDLIEQQAAEDWAVYQSTGKWPRKVSTD